MPSIEQIAAGEKVWSYDLVSQRWELRTVLQPHITPYEDDLI